MAINEAYSNTATISTTEYSLPNNSTTLTPITADGVYQVFIDFFNMASGDEYLIKVYEKVTSGGTQRVIFTASLLGIQSPPVWVAPSMIFLHGWDVTVTRIAGTNRSISWSIRQVA